jgi:hypothetical protein
MTTSATITVVSGLPRSGTSMMMQMLAAGGLPVLTDGRRSADADNPRGYYEYEAVKSLAQDASWLACAHGKAVKIVSALLAHLPDGCEYRVIFMRRPMAEVLASQRAMLERLGRAVPGDDDARLGELFARHLDDVAALLRRRPSIARLDVNYPDVIAAPLRVAAAVNAFLGGALDPAQMAATVAPELHRKRR